MNRLALLPLFGLIAWAIVAVVPVILAGRPG